MDEDNKALVVFQDKKIRRTWNNNEWWFSVIDVVSALTDSVDPKDYWYRLKIREKENSEIELSTFCRQLKLMSGDGKFYETDCANTPNMFRIIQSIPSPKAEPFKQWLASVGYQRIQEIQDPQLAQKRMIELYRAKGYSESWIEKRIRGIAIRDELTEEWKNRGVNEGLEFAILTNEISKATFGLTPNEDKDLKGLKRQNLRDHMNDWELIFTMFGEKATADITKANNSKGFDNCKTSAEKGGNLAGNARLALEKEIGKSIVSNENYLKLSQVKSKTIENKKQKKIK
ncbi:MAG: Bro-N domain-containing protein [archaeon]